MSDNDNKYYALVAKFHDGKIQILKKFDSISAEKFSKIDAQNTIKEFCRQKNIDISNFMQNIESLKLIAVSTNFDSEADNLPAVTVEIDNNDLFQMIRQGQATNRLTKINARKRDNLKLDILSQSVKILADENFAIEIKNFPKSGELKNSTLQLLDALTLKFTETDAKSRCINLSLHEYMNMRGIKNEKTAREQVKIDLEILYNLSLHYKEKRHGKFTGTFIDVRLIDKKGVIKNSVIGLRITPEFYALLQTYNIMPYPIRLLALNNQANPHSYYFGRKITEHKNMNYFQPNADIISVETLLKSSPVMPALDEVSKNGQHYIQQIITPFERDMNALDEIFMWEYCHSNGTPLSEQDFDILYGQDKNNPSYQFFITLLVKITWRNYPERTKLKAPKNHKRKNIKKNESQSLPPIAL